jgi:hypothetical protein
MKKKRYLALQSLFFLCLVLLTACGKLNQINYSPLTTPGDWLRIQPFVTIRLFSLDLILIQPSTSIIVFLLGFLAVGIGILFLSKRSKPNTLIWWGSAMLLWGIGAILAGISYEAFSYSIKCAGREFCLWTSWWEIGYLLVTIWSINAMTMAVAYSSTTGWLRRVLFIYAPINSGIYLILLMVGVFTPIKFLISFEFMLALGAPSFVAFFVINLIRYQKIKSKSDLVLIGAWLWLALTVAAYFIYFSSNLTTTFWVKGIWFSENDVLHILLIIWMLYIVLKIGPSATDLLPVE